MLFEYSHLKNAKTMESSYIGLKSAMIFGYAGGQNQNSFAAQCFIQICIQYSSLFRVNKIQYVAVRCRFGARGFNCEVFNRFLFLQKFKFRN